MRYKGQKLSMETIEVRETLRHLRANAEEVVKNRYMQRAIARFISEKCGKTRFFGKKNTQEIKSITAEALKFIQNLNPIKSEQIWRTEGYRIRCCVFATAATFSFERIPAGIITLIRGHAPNGDTNWRAE